MIYNRNTDRYYNIIQYNRNTIWKYNIRNRIEEIQQYNTIEEWNSSFWLNEWIDQLLIEYTQYYVD